MNPTYTNILKEVGAQINKRKKSLFIRTFMISWPALLAIVLGYVAVKLFGKDMVQQLALTYPYFVYIIIYIVLAWIYISIVSFIFEIEKRIWIDSFFDGKEMPPAKSWKLSKKLLWPAVVFRFRLFVKYTLLPLVISLVVLGIVAFGIYNTLQTVIFDQNLLYTYIAIGVLDIIIYNIYLYYLRIKLRFSWFVFLDTYKGGSVDTGAVLEKMITMNKTAKSEGFKKALVVAIGTDSFGAIMKSAVSIMSQGIGTVATKIPGIGDAGKMVGDLTQAYGQELAQQVASYAQIAGIYLLYIVAHKETYGTEQEVNDYVYNLVA
ncbi:MAG: hypothetical protein WCO09_01485 [bacterium]